MNFKTTPHEKKYVIIIKGISFRARTMHMVFNPKIIVAVIGLGNPLPEYAQSYHNVGFLCIDAFMRFFSLHREDVSPLREYPTGKKAILVHTKVRGVHLMKPLTFMNESGKATGFFINHFKLKVATVLVVHDDSDLPLGTWKFSFGRGDAGHNGIRSLFNQLGTRDFWRLRIGIRNPDTRRDARAMQFVLSRIAETELATLETAFSNIFTILFKL